MLKEGDLALAVICYQIGDCPQQDLHQVLIWDRHCLEVVREDIIELDVQH